MQMGRSFSLPSAAPMTLKQEKMQCSMQKLSLIHIYMCIRDRTWILAVFMAVNIAVSSMALIRYDLRAEGKPPKNSVESIIDERFDDARMEKIYPNALSR